MWLIGRRESATSDLWADGQPNNLNRSQDCVDITGNVEANDKGWAKPHITVCKKRINA